MTDPIVPAPAPEPAPQPVYQQPAPAAPSSYPGKGLGIGALVVALLGIFVWFLAPIVGLIMGGVARSQSKKAGFKNGPATAAIVIGIILLVLHVLGVVLFGSVIFAIIQNCPEVAPGVYSC